MGMKSMLESMAQNYLENKLFGTKVDSFRRMGTTALQKEQELISENKSELSKKERKIVEYLLK